MDGQRQKVETVLSRTSVYTHPALLRSQLHSLVTEFRELWPDIGPFPRPGGGSANLVFVRGTIPVRIGGNNYHIPIQAWFPERFPQNGPIVYVVPTETMTFNPSHPNLGPGGICQHPTLSNWSSSMTINSVMYALQSVFSAHSPVYARTVAPKSTPPVNPYAATSGVSSLPSSSSSSSHSYSTYTPPPSSKPPDHPKGPDRDRLRKLIEERLEFQLGAFEGEIAKEMDSLHSENERLLRHQKEVHRLEESIEDDEKELLKQTKELTDDLEKLESKKENELGKKELAADDIYETPSIEKQHAEVITRVRTHEDVLYILSKGLERRVITVDEWMHRIRSTARDLFMEKALLRKLDGALQARRRDRA